MSRREQLRSRQLSEELFGLVAAWIERRWIIPPSLLWILLMTHDREVEAAADRVYELRGGRLSPAADAGTPA